MSTNGTRAARQALPTPQTLPPVDWALPQDEPVAELERQLERGSQFTQAALDKLVGRLAGAEAYITELVGLLKARGVLTDDDLVDVDEEDDDEAPPSAEAAAVPQAEASSREAVATGDGAQAESSPQAGQHKDPLLDASGTQATVNWPGIAFRVDPEDPAPPVQVNCAERMHVCHAVCCKLNFALTPEEVEAGKVKWDLGFPYLIRHGSNGYCCHNDTTTGRCTAYADRPGVCHRYTCANDKRIWKDFDNMVLNEEWIRANLSNQTRITVRAGLPLMDVRHGNGAAPNEQGTAPSKGSTTG